MTRGAANDQAWRFDIARQTFSEMTFEWDNAFPIWTPDGKSVIVSSTPGWRRQRVRADGTGAPEPVSMGTGPQFPGSVAPDGKALAFHEVGTNTGSDIWVAPLDTRGPPREFLHTPANEQWPAISPDGRLIAYESDESGQTEVYLRSFPDGSNKIRVSSGGGWEPSWARSGKELHYLVLLEAPKSRMMVADVSPGTPLRVSRGRALFENSYVGWDVFPDGQHFVMVEADQEVARVTQFKVVLNWFEELKRLAPPM